MKNRVLPFVLILLLLLSGCFHESKKGQNKAKPETPFFRYMEKADYALFYQGKKDLAIRNYTSAILAWTVWDGRDNLAQAYYNRGGAYYESRKRKKAVSDLRKAVELGHPDARRVLKEDFNESF